MRQGGSYVVKPDGTEVLKERTTSHEEGDGARDAEGKTLDRAVMPKGVKARERTKTAPVDAAQADAPLADAPAAEAAPTDAAQKEG